MQIPDSIKQFLANSGARITAHSVGAAAGVEQAIGLAEIPADQVVKAVLLRSGKHPLLAVIRADQQLDLQRIAALFKRDFALCDEAEIRLLTAQGEPGWLSPLATVYGIKAIVDPAVTEREQVYCALGVAGVLIQVSAADFATLMGDSWQGRQIASVARPAAQAQAEDMRRQVQQLNRLPSMPGLAMELLRVRHNPYAHASELAAVIEQDPSLSAQLIRYANSPLYAYPGKIESVEQAIIRVLGMDFVQDVAFGLSLGKAFNNPRHGELGLEQFWRHALYSAALAQALCNRMEFARRPSPGIAYLAGLLHNFGLLLLGHLFPAQWRRLNLAREKYPERALPDLERALLGVSHTEMGLWLMEAWDMPREICETVSGHHNPELTGDYTIYANLVFVANALLKRHGIGDSPVDEVPASLLARIGLNTEQLEQALEAVLAGQENLDFMVAKMAA